MKIAKSPPWLVELFKSLAPGEQRLMFGSQSSFTNGQLFTGVFQGHLFVRLAESDRAEALALPGATRFAPMPGRPMKEYVVLPDSLLEDEQEVRRWMDRAAAFARSLPPKEKAGAKKKGAAKKPAPARKSAPARKPAPASQQHAASRSPALRKAPAR